MSVTRRESTRVGRVAEFWDANEELVRIVRTPAGVGHVAVIVATARTAEQLTDLSSACLAARDELLAMRAAE
jgi:hypothetical protein